VCAKISAWNHYPARGRCYGGGRRTSRSLPPRPLWMAKSAFPGNYRMAWSILKSCFLRIRSKMCYRKTLKLAHPSIYFNILLRLLTNSHTGDSPLDSTGGEIPSLTPPGSSPLRLPKFRPLVATVWSVFGWIFMPVFVMCFNFMFHSWAINYFTYLLKRLRR